MPCLGTSLPIHKIVAIKQQYDTLYVWLDSDKFKEAILIANKAAHVGLSTRAIYSELDPKCYSDDEIKEYLS